MAFILGQLVKEKARLYQLQRFEHPELVTIKVSELEERVRILDVNSDTNKRMIDYE